MRPVISRGRAKAVASKVSKVSKVSKEMNRDLSTRFERLELRKDWRVYFVLIC